MVGLDLSYKDFMFMYNLKIITAISVVLGIGVIINIMDIPLRCVSMSLCMGTILLMTIFGVMLIAKSITDISVK